MLADDDGLGDAEALGVAVDVVEMDGVVEIVVIAVCELKSDTDALILAELDADRDKLLVLDGDNPDDGVSDTDAQDDTLWLDESVVDTDSDKDADILDERVESVLTDTEILEESDMYNEELGAGDGVADTNADEDALRADDPVVDTDAEGEELQMGDCVLDTDAHEDILSEDDSVTYVLIDADTVDESEACEDEDIVYDDIIDPVIDVVPVLDTRAELEPVADRLTELLVDCEPLVVLDLAGVIDTVGDTVGDLDFTGLLDGLTLTELLRELTTVLVSEYTADSDACEDGERPKLSDGVPVNDIEALEESLTSLDIVTIEE